MILSTTPQIEGHPIREYKGVVTGEVIIGANVLKDFMAGLTDFFGGRSGSYEKVLIEAKDSSMQSPWSQCRSRNRHRLRDHRSQWFDAHGSHQRNCRSYLSKHHEYGQQYR